MNFMKFRFILAVWLAVSAWACAQTQPIQEVSLCQLRQDAALSDHKVVRVRGTVEFEFENFSLFDPQCADAKATTVWLTYGGDVSDIAVYCCGDHSRAPGNDIRIDGKPVPLLKDSAYEQFHKLLQAGRIRLPNGQPCYSKCRFFQVSATLTGLFLAEKDIGKEHVGYGHLGCCSLLMIEQVSDVSAKRTSVPVGTLECQSSTWTPTAADLPEWNSYVRCEAYCDMPGHTLIERVAAHWGDATTVSGGSTDGPSRDATGPHPVDRFSWISNDMLTSYAMLAENTDPPKFSVTREVCRQAEKKPSLRLPISCDDFATTMEWGPERRSEYERLIDEEKYALAEKMLVDSAEDLSSKGEQSWRTKPLRTAAHEIVLREIPRWGISVDPKLRADKCSGPGSLDHQQYSYASCSWYSPDGMQELSVTLMQRKKDAAHSRWLLNSANARICHFDASLNAASVHAQ